MSPVGGGGEGLCCPCDAPDPLCTVGPDMGLPPRAIRGGRGGASVTVRPPTNGPPSASEGGRCAMRRAAPRARAGGRGTRGGGGKGGAHTGHNWQRDQRPPPPSRGHRDHKTWQMNGSVLKRYFGEGKLIHVHANRIGRMSATPTTVPGRQRASGIRPRRTGVCHGAVQVPPSFEPQYDRRARRRHYPPTGPWARGNVPVGALPNHIPRDGAGLKPHALISLRRARPGPSPTTSPGAGRRHDPSSITGFVKPRLELSTGGMEMGDECVNSGFRNTSRGLFGSWRCVGVELEVGGASRTL